MPAHPVKVKQGERVPFRVEVRPDIKNAVVTIAEREGVTLRTVVERALLREVIYGADR